MGLSLEGVDKPVPSLGNHVPSSETHDDEITDNTPVPYHKQALLNLVTNLHIVHASSSVPLSVEDCYLVMPTYERRTLVSLEGCRADRLGKTDLDGYILADDIIRRRGPGHPTFKRLKTLALGAWDDRRWGTYAVRQSKARLDFSDPTVYQRIRDDADYKLSFLFETGVFRRPATLKGRIDRNACPVLLVEGLLWRTFHDARPDTACTRPDAIFQTSEADGIEGSELTIKHEPQLRSEDIYSPYPSRLYVTTEAFKTDKYGVMERNIRMMELNLDHHSQQKFVFDVLPDASYIGAHNLDMPRVELCISPKTQGDEGQLRLAREIKEALETFRQRNKKHAEKHLQKFRILVGDEIPPCPCCGSRI